MPTVRGREEMRRFMAQLPGQIEAKVLRGAARAAIGVVKAEAADRVTSDEVRDALTVSPTKVEGGLVTVRLKVKGQWPNSVANWLEYGTSPHFITVDDSQREGMTAARINRLGKAGTLVIGGKPVGKTVHHPGARPHPFMRVSLDLREQDAIAAAQSYINAHVTPAGIIDGGEPTAGA